MFNCMYVPVCTYVCVCMCVGTVFAGAKRSLQGHRAAELLCFIHLGYCDQ